MKRPVQTCGLILLAIVLGFASWAAYKDPVNQKAKFLIPAFIGGWGALLLAGRINRYEEQP